MKDPSTESFPKVYEPHEVEDRWIKFWMDKKLFAPCKIPSPKGTPSPPQRGAFGQGSLRLGGGEGQGERGVFSVVIPPPNVTGSLHMGHALNNTLQDILVRYHRMKGDNTLWVVGTDHAGIATQNVVEKKLHAEGLSRHDLGREKFVEKVWQWRKESGGTIINQLKRLGASCDYDHERFTMDEGLSSAVRKVFVRLYKDGLIYRGLRLINWCPRCHTALSDLEVEHEEQKGYLWHIKYGNLVVATTRPETMLGDTAVAVNPTDERHQNWIGKKVLLPLIHREIPVIADSAVEMSFGTGAVKITPAHDFNDFFMGERHGLERINIFTESATINENGGSYAGLTREKAREKVVQDLEALGLIDKIEPHAHAVGHCYRCKKIVEPYLSWQWFVKTKPLAKPAIDAVKNKQTKFVPLHWEKTYFNWMENIQDWCISRQIWWGHQIPAWYCCKSPSASLPSSALPAAYISSTPQSASSGRLASGAFTAVPSCPPVVSETIPEKCPTCGSTELTQDPDVLDTWFSSALWPFSTLGWPDETEALKTFYPTSVLVTAFDIIFFWVARMMMMGIYFMKEVPFRDVHIHAIVRDPLGQKMSKSKGNVVDPLILMKKYGTDAFRFTLSAFAAQGRDIKLDEARVEGYRNFCNKIWNASRFALMNAAPFIKEETDFAQPKPALKVNRWILGELSQAIRETEEGIVEYQFNRAAGAVYTFFWHDFCDWYLELTKSILKEGNDHEKIETAKTTFHVLDGSLRLLHPFMPFITEEIWQILGIRHGRSIVHSSFPVSVPLDDEDEKAKEEYELLIEIISAIRSIRQETAVPLSSFVPLIIQTDAVHQTRYENLAPVVSKLAKIESIRFYEKEVTEPCAVVKTRNAILYIPLSGLLDLEKELNRQRKKLAKTEADLTQLRQKLEDPRFVKNVDPLLVHEKQIALKQAMEEKELLLKGIRLLELKGVF